MVADSRVKNLAPDPPGLARAGGSRTLLLAFAFLSVFALGGCAGRIPEIRYYLLSEAPVGAAASADLAGASLAAGTEQPMLKLQAVQVPDYLQTRGLVVAVTDNRVRAANYHQWAEPLAAGLERYLGGALAAAVADAEAQGPRAAVTVVLEHLHGSEAGPAVLDAQWQLRSPEDNRLLLQGHFEETAPQPESGYPALVEAHRRLLDRLAATIVARWGAGVPEGTSD